MYSAKSRSANKRGFVFLAVLALILLGAALLSLCAGSYSTPVGELIRGLFGRAADRKVNIVVQNNRLPRMLTAIVAGAGLGASGCVLQAILRNPLASSSTLGVSQGAGFGAAFAIIVLNAGASAYSGVLVPVMAFVGSMAVALLILALTRLTKISAEGIVLSGVAISSMLSGATTLIQYFADEVQLSTLVFWTFGDLASPGWKDIRVMAAVVALTGAYFMLHRWDYNALLSGTETAHQRGRECESDHDDQHDSLLSDGFDDRFLYWIDRVYRAGCAAHRASGDWQQPRLPDSGIDADGRGAASAGRSGGADGGESDSAADWRDYVVPRRTAVFVFAV